jgi:septal ring factor EnvC (AmiA/AmiB activator)
MVEVSNELLCEVLKQMQKGQHQLKDSVGEIKQELVSIRGQLASLNQDIANIHRSLGRHDDRLDRIERWFEPREMAQGPQSPFHPTT